MVTPRLFILCDNLTGEPVTVIYVSPFKDCTREAVPYMAASDLSGLILDGYEVTSRRGRPCMQPGLMSYTRNIVTTYIFVNLSVVGILMKTKFKPRNDVTEWSGKEREQERSHNDCCETPMSNESVDDEMLPIPTKLVLAVKYNLIQFNAVPVTPKVSKSLLRRTA